MLTISPVPYEPIDMALLRQNKVHLSIKRLDLIHPLVSGNKWYKLKYNLREIKSQGYRQLLTFGGAYSNHIHATAIAASLLDIPAISVIRGEETLPLNPTLEAARAAGMKLHYIPRSAYREKNSLELIRQLENTFGDFYLLPEGGTNTLAIRGTEEILQTSDFESDVICTSIGTGGTFVGLVSSAKSHQKVLGFSALKGQFIHSEIDLSLDKYAIHPRCAFEVLDRYHFGGYARFNQELIDFILSFKETTGIALDPIYTGKMMYGIFDLIRKGAFPAGTKILALHTGGIQTNDGFNRRHGTNLPLS